MFHVEVFWVVTPCSIVLGYQCYGELPCLHLQVKKPDLDAYSSSKPPYLEE